MINKKKKLFSFLFSGVLLLTFLIPAVSVGEWAVEQDDIYKFDITGWTDDVIELDGYFELEITDLDSNGDLTYDLTCFFDVDDNDEESGLEKSDVVVSSTFGLFLFVVLVYTVEDFTTFKADVDNMVLDFEDSYDSLYGSNDNVTYTITELEYGFGIELENAGTNTTSITKWQWDEEGVLKHMESTYTDDDGKNGFLIKQQGFDLMEFIKSIPGYSLGSFLPIFVISIGLLVVYKRKK